MLANEFVDYLVQKERISREEVESLTDSQKSNLFDYKTGLLVLKGDLEASVAKDLSADNRGEYSESYAEAQSELLKVLKDLIEGGKLTEDEANALNYAQVINLKEPEIKDLIIAGKLSVEDAKDMTEGQRYACVMLNPLILAGKTNSSEAMHMNEEQVKLKLEEASISPILRLMQMSESSKTEPTVAPGHEGGGSAGGSRP